MTLVPPLYFVMHMDRLAIDAERVAHLMETKYKSDILLDNKIIVSHSIEREAQLLRGFPLLFRGMIEAAALIQPNDFFGNHYEGFDSYDFIEIVVSFDYSTLSSVRFLGTKNGQPIRFSFYALPNIIFDATTLNIVSQIRDISDSIQDFFGKIFDLFCTPGLNFPDDISNIVNTSKLLTKINQVDVTSSIGWYNFVTTYFSPYPIIVSRSSLSQEDLEAIQAKFDTSLTKTFADLQNEASDFFGLKSEIASLAKNGFEVNNAAKAAFFTDLDKEIQTLGALYSNVFDVFTLGCLISEALDCIRPPISCPDLLRELPPDVLKARVALAFPTNPQALLGANRLIDRIVQETKDNNLPPANASDRIIDELATIIDVDAICSLNIPFAIPKIEMPKLPTIDLLREIALQLDQAILEALAKALIDLILGILKDLFDCGKLDNFIAGLLNGQINDDSGAYGDLAKLFTNPSSLGKDSAIANSLGNRWSNFVNTASPLMGKLVDFSATGSVGTDQVQFGKVVNGEAGISGLQDLLLSGSFDKVGPSLGITKVQDVVYVDVTKLNQDDPNQVHQFIEEVAVWDLSSDENSFTLNNLSQERIVFIAGMSNVPAANLTVNKPSQKSQAIIDGVANNTAETNVVQGGDQSSHLFGSHDIKISGEEIFKEIGQLFDTVISVLSPTETINLLAGKATTETLNTVLELIKIRNPRLFLFIGTVQKVATVFELFGKSAGLDSLRNKLLLLTASPDAQRVLKPTLPCPPFEDVLAFRKELLKRTLPEDQVVKIIDDLISSGKKRFNDIQDGLIKIQNGLTPLEALQPILCGTGKTSNGKRPAIVEDTLNSTINLMFEPTRMMFDREIQKYVDAVSITKENLVEVPRKASIDNNIPIFNPGASQGNVFSDLSSMLGLSGDQQAQDKQSDRINPEFKKMVDSGYVPTKKTGDKAQDFSVDGSKDKDYIDGSEPVFKKDTIKKPGAAFKDGIQFSDDDIDLDLSRKFKITLKGSLDTQSPVSSFTPFKVPTPEWIIEYTEKDRTTFNIRAGGQIHSGIYGLIPFSENYRIQKDEVVVEDNLKQEIENFTNSSQIPPRQDVFTSIFETKVLPSIVNKNEFKPLMNEMFEEKFESYVKATIREIGNGFARNRLLKKVPNNSLTKLAASGMNFGNSKTDDLIALNLINFSPMQTEKQRMCNLDPHLLDFDFVKKVVKDRFDKECEQDTADPSQQLDGLSSRRTPINSAGFVGVVMTIIRLYTIEYILRTLFVLDEFKFSKDFPDDDLLIDYITFRMMADIERLGFDKEFQKEAFITYDKLLKDGIIQPYSNKINSCSDIDATSQTVKPELKALVKSQMVSAMERISTILGIDTKKIVNLKTVFFDGLDTIDTFSDFGEPKQQTTYTANNQRLNTIQIPNSGKFVFERYLRIKQPTNLLVPEGFARTAIRLEQDSNPFLSDVINFTNWEEFIAKLTSQANLLGIQNKKIYDPNDVPHSLFEHPWKIGLRLVYIPPEFGPKIERTNLTNSKNVFKVTANSTNEFAPLNPNDVNTEKSFYVFDKQPNEPAFLSDNKKEYFKQYNPIPVLEKEIEISDFITLKDANKKGIFDAIFEQKYFKTLKEQLENDVESDLLINYCLFSKRLLSLFMIHSTMVLNGEQVKFLFEGTKQELRKLFLNLGTLGNYVAKTETKINGGNAGQFQRKFNSIGNPAGPSGPSAFYFWSTTPIHILRALATMTDPNIFWADKIVAAAASGFLTPKLARVGATVRIEGTNDFVNTTGDIALDNDFKMLQTGEIVKLKQGTGGIGKPFIEYSPVALIENIVDGKVTLKQEQYPDGTKGPAIRAGTGFSGVPWDKGSNGPGPGINLNSFNALFDQRPSAPIYPGEQVNIPYGLASLALTPMQIFATILGPLCQTMYNPTLPLGQEFLALEPLIYNLPHYQIATADTSTAQDLKETGLDLKGAENITCEDDKKKTT